MRTYVVIIMILGLADSVKDDSGWTPLMIAASVKDGDAIVELLLSRGADINQKSTAPSFNIP